MAIYDIYGRMLLGNEVFSTNPLYVQASSRGEQQAAIQWQMDYKQKQYEDTCKRYDLPVSHLNTSDDKDDMFEIIDSKFNKNPAKFDLYKTALDID